MPDAALFMQAMLHGFIAIGALAAVTWLASIAKRDASIVDGIWSVMVVLPMLACIVLVAQPSPRALAVCTLAGLWATRLAFYIVWRNWNEPEDHRYREIRARNEPGFGLKSAYLVFGLQGLLALVVSLPLAYAVASAREIAWLDVLGVALCAVGIAYETIADAQLARFKSRAENRGRVLDSGLWRHTRHPNYFGEFCVWWGFYLIALAAGGWWTIASPFLMTVLLFKVSGVVLLEKDIASRRPAYRDYVESTNAFFPGPRRAR